VEVRKMIAIGYARVSSSEQVNGTSLESQRQSIESYCTMKGIELIGVLIDAGVSGGLPLKSRPEGSKVWEALNSGQANSLVISKLDRGFRSASDCLNNVETWAKKGVNLHVLNLGGQTIDTGTPTGKFFITIMAGAAELEKNLIRERCNEGRKNRKAQSKRTGEIPYGFDLALDGKILVENASEQLSLSLIHDLHQQGRSLRAIADELNNRNIKPKKGIRWNHTTIRSILKRAA
jgi:DNA invertase Pin-like site-specific DNA recombinase